jgi:hypothetical protein
MRFFASSCYASNKFLRSIPRHETGAVCCQNTINPFVVSLPKDSMLAEPNLLGLPQIR